MVAKQIILTVEDLEGVKDQSFWELLAEELMEYAEGQGVEVVVELQDLKGVKKDGEEKR